MRICNHPTVVSLDIDRTLVDRSRTHHRIDPGLGQILSRLAVNSAFQVVLNTGRDRLALELFDDAIGLKLPAVFLSGRAWRLTDGRVGWAEDAILPNAVLSTATELLFSGSVPNLDIRGPRGTVYMAAKPCVPELEPLGFQKPPGWYGRQVPQRVLVSSPETALNVMYDLCAMRLEIPFASHSALEDNAIVVQLRSALALDYHFKVLGPHAGWGPAASNWSFVQILSPLVTHNKARGLACLLSAIEVEPVRVVHFGDTTEGHNSDAAFSELAAEFGSEFVPVALTDGHQRRVHDSDGIVGLLSELLRAEDSHG